MKILPKFKKSQIKNQRIASANKVSLVNPSCINVNSVVIVHTGNVLTIEDINKNRSSKYKYLAF